MSKDEFMALCQRTMGFLFDVYRDNFGEVDNLNVCMNCVEGDYFGLFVTAYDQGEPQMSEQQFGYGKELAE